MMKRGGIVFAVVALVVLAGCAAPVGEPPVETVTVTASASPEAEPVREVVESPEVDKEALFLEGARSVMPIYGFTEAKLSDQKILSEGRKFCDQGDDYEGDPTLNKKLGATKALVFQAKIKLC